MFQLNLLNCHIQHIIICLYICSVTHSMSSDLHKFTVHKSSWHEIQETSEGWKWLFIQDIPSVMFVWPSKYKHIAVSIHICLFTIFLGSHKLSCLLSNTAQSRKNYYRKQLHLPLMQNCMTLVSGEFIKSFCKQCFIWARVVVEGIPHTAVCTWGQIHIVSRVGSMNTFKILKIIN